MADVIDLAFRVNSLELAEANRELSAMEGTGKQAAGGMSLFTAAVSALGAIGLGKVLEDTLTEYKGFQSMIAGLTTATGGIAAAKIAMSDLQSFAETTPFALDQSVAGFIKLTNLGLDASMGAMTSYGNTSSAMTKTMMDMIEAVADASTFQFERLREFGITTQTEGDSVIFTFDKVSTEVGKRAEEIEAYLRTSAKLISRERWKRRWIHWLANYQTWVTRFKRCRFYSRIKVG